jgi:hypothetical protein
MRWSHYREFFQKKSGGAAYDDLETPPLKENQFLIVDHVSVENETTAYTNLRVGIKSGTTFTPLLEEKTPAAGEVVWTDEELKITEHERFCCRLTGCTSGDVLKATIQGKLYQLEQ